MIIGHSKRNYHRKCVACGDEFIAHNSRGLYCSNNCNANSKYWRDHPLENKTCLICGKTFQTRVERRKYCCHLCAVKACNRMAKERKHGQV